jgi:hypothetical protein
VHADSCGGPVGQRHVALEYVVAGRWPADHYLAPTSLVYYDVPEMVPAGPGDARWEEFQAGAREIWEAVQPLLAEMAGDLLALEKAVYALHDVGSVKGQIAQMFYSTAQWRDGLVDGYPDDSRNAPAARHMYRIAAELITLPDDDSRLQAVTTAWEACLTAESFPDKLDPIIRGYGFGWGGHGAYYPDLAEVLDRISGELGGE